MTESRPRATEIAGTERGHFWDDHVAALPEFGGYPNMTDHRIPVLVLEPVA